MCVFLFLFFLSTGFFSLSLFVFGYEIEDENRSHPYFKRKGLCCMSMTMRYATRMDTRNEKKVAILLAALLENC